MGRKRVVFRQTNRSFQGGSVDCAQSCLDVKEDGVIRKEKRKTGLQRWGHPVDI